MDRRYWIKNRKELTKNCPDIFGWILQRNATLPVAIVFFLLAASFSALGQSAGDFRSIASGNWSNVNTWQYFTGATWTNASPYGYPGQNASGAAVQIRDNVTINLSPPRSIGTLTIDGDQSLNSSGDPNLTVTGNVHLQAGWLFVPIPSSVSFGNGDLSIGGSLTLDNGCSLTLGSGIFTSPGIVDLEVYIFGSYPATIQNNGTATLSNTGSGILSGGGQWTQGTNSVLNYAGSTLSVGTFNASAIGNLVNYNRNGAQTIDAPTSNTYHHLTLQGSGTKTSSNNLDINGDLTIAGSAQLDVDSGDDNINLTGDWNITSSSGDPFLQGTQSVTLDGTTAQTITPSTGGETFYNLTLNNIFGASPQITLNGAVSVTGTLTMTEGNVNLNGNNFTIGTSAVSPGTLSHNGTSARGWMYGGNLIRYMANAATTIGNTDQYEGFFPLGSASDWRPFYVGKNNTANSGGRIIVSHTNSTSTSTVTGFPEGIVRRHNSFWTVSTSGISAGTWSLRAGGTNFGTIGNVSHLRMSTSTGVVATHSGGTGSTTDPQVNRTGLTYAQLTNNFHLASTNAGSSPLPIELLSFSAQLNNNFVELKWSTASETNNDFFTIERSTSVEYFDPILQIDGAGTTKELNEYNDIDPSPLYGRSYYRLKQTDFDGTFTYSSVRVINYEGPEHSTLTVFPNPSSGKSLSITIEGLRDATEVPLQILNMQGQKVYEKTISVKTPGVITDQISREKILPSGIYIIKAGSTLYLTQKIVVE